MKDDDDYTTDLEVDFKKELLEEYLSILRKGYEYIQSREYLEEGIRANEYTFLEDGTIKNY